MIRITKSQRMFQKQYNEYHTINEQNHVISGLSVACYLVLLITCTERLKKGNDDWSKLCERTEIM